MKLKHKKLYHLCNYENKEDDEGNIFEGYSDPIEIYANIYPASGQLQAQEYGERLKYINNMLIDGNYNITSDGVKRYYHFKDFVLSEGDGICVYTTDKPDYKIISIKPWSHLECEIEVIEQ